MTAEWIEYKRYPDSKVEYVLDIPGLRVYLLQNREQNFWYLVCDDFNLDEELETDIGSSKRIAEKIVIARLHQDRREGRT